MINDIAIHLTGSGEDAFRIGEAAAVARTLDARLTGIYLHQLPEVLAITDPSGSAFLRRLVAQSEAEAEAAVKAADQDLRRFGLPYEVRRLDVYPRQAGEAMSNLVRQSDLFVGTRPYGDPDKAQAIEEAVLFQSGRPCLFVPPSYQRRSVCENVLLAWKNTPEAARAVADAMPLLKRAKSVVVAIVDEALGAPEEQGNAPDEDVGRYLSRHGIKADVHIIDGWTNTGAAILNEAARTAAHLIVMGAYGHSRLREWLLGGATREVLSSAPVPVLVSH
ncbi:universal stress protein [Devosia sp. A16]|uniref:universal stress protein n=1 Tax=Devosia sp. A16 TaxID=1736675 RepID=UPI0006D7D930|nr:universal stress protein [Devosia sp. A16]